MIRVVHGVAIWRGCCKKARNEVCVAGRELSAVDEDLPLFVLLTILPAPPRLAPLQFAPPLSQPRLSDSVRLKRIQEI
jgi:hypothetical protein